MFSSSIRLDGVVKAIDLFICTRFSVNESFGPARKLGDQINTPTRDDHPCLLQNGLKLVFYRSQPGDKQREYWISSRQTTNQPFGRAEKLILPEIDLSEGPHLTDDERTLLYHSELKGGYGGSDLWMSSRSLASGPFGEPVNLGPEINGEFDDRNPYLSPDRCVLLFDSRRSKLGLWMSTRETENSPFTKPVKLPSIIHRHGVNREPTLSADGKILIFSSNRTDSAGKKNRQLWMSRRVLR